MKLSAALSAVLLWGVATACDGQAPASKAAPTKTSHAMSTTTTSAAAPRYDVRGIFDPGFGGIVAMAFKVPHGWQVQQSFKRAWINAYPIEQVYIGFFSPGGHQAYEGLPQLHYTYDSSPISQQMEQRMQQMTGQRDPSHIAPMLPLPYLKQVLLPLLAQKANLHPRIVAEHQDPATQPQPGVQLATGYLDCVLPSGRKLRVQTQLMIFQTPQAPQYVMWTADNLLIQTDGDLAAAVAQQAAIQKSGVQNPAWVRQNEALQSRGMDINTEQGKASLARLQAQQKTNFEQFQQRMATQRQQFDQHHANWVAQQHANDQSSQAFRDYLGGQTLYQNPETGQRTRVDNTYNHVYQDGQGHTLATNAPLSAGNINWQELQQVELKNY